MPKTKIFNLRFFNVARGQSLSGSQVQMNNKKTKRCLFVFILVAGAGFEPATFGLDYASLRGVRAYALGK